VALFGSHINADIFNVIHIHCRLGSLVVACNHFVNTNKALALQNIL